MAKRKRRPTDAGDYEDPLSNYDEPEFDDDLERALAEDEVGKMTITPMSTVDPSMSIRDAMAMMTDKDIFCLLVVEDDKLIGIFTERDVLEKVADNWDAMKDKSVREAMTPDPDVVYEMDCPAKALNLMAVGSFRHVPVVNIDKKPVGILGPRRTTAFIEDHLAQRSED